MYWPAYSWYEVCIFRRDGSADPAGEDITVLPAISMDHHNVERFAGELAGTGWMVVQNGGVTSGSSSRTASPEGITKCSQSSGCQDQWTGRRRTTGEEMERVL